MTRARRPNAVKYHDPRPAYIKSLLLVIGRPIPEVAERAGIARSALYRYINPATPLSGLAPYPVQVTLEQLAMARVHDADKHRLRRRSNNPDPLDSSEQGK